MLNLLTNLFPVWVTLGGVLALVWPAAFTWFTPFIVPALAVVMLGMGITLSIDDFRAVVKMPKAVAAGFVAQYTVMPFLGWLIAHTLKLESQFAAGLILVACCPGGTASNIVTYLAKANVPLSVLMTMCSTFGAVILTPFLTQWLAGTYVPVDAWGLFRSTATVVLLPLIAGLALHHGTPRLVNAILPMAPLVSVFTVALICSSIIGESADAILKSGVRLVAAVFALHAGGFLLGYGFARILGYDVTIRRTIAIEVGMQNSGLGVALARKHFTAAAAVPCAISSVFHSVIGSVLAGYWRIRSPVDTQAPR